MANDNTIQKNPALRPDQDFANLRQAGLQYIQDLGSNIWTDYNEHDPGITILEALCYAITELGYRTALPMKDLLAGKDGAIPSSQTFYTAKKILTQSPLTIDDYRKLLIDIPGVQNAWLQIASSEVPLYADCKKEILTYQPTSTPIAVSGLYRVLLDLDEDPQLGDLNNGSIDLVIYLPSGGGSSSSTVSLTLDFPAWNAVSDASLFDIDIQHTASIPIVMASFPDPAHPLAITLSYNTTSFTGTLTINTASSGTIPGNAVIQSLFTTDDTASSYNFLLQNVFLLYLKKIQQAREIVRLATRTLYCHRNLCEDFACINTIQDEEIAFCFDVDTSPNADINSIQANIYLAITNYLDPPVNFYLLSEMLTKQNSQGQKYTVDEIFDGPRLKHGFIDTTELEASQLASVLYSSEIIHLIMNIEGVVGVRGFLMTGYLPDGTIQGQAGQAWCLPVLNGYKPILSQDKSKITYYKEQIPYSADKILSEKLFEQWLATQQSSKLTGHADDLPVPTGDYFPVDAYTSVQYEFPMTYGIGTAGLPSTVTDARRAQARQLKAYLLFYDQLLADFLSQLRNAGNLFSTDPIVQTYYAQFVGGFKDADAIYTGDATGFFFHNKVLATQDSTIAAPNPPNGWESQYEPNETFTDRRNRFLDHLLARFAESFSDYTFLLYSLNEATQIETSIDPTDLINNKIEFLQDYPRMSYDRARAYNYCPLDEQFQLIASKLWNTDNVSGLEEKLCLQGGFKDPSNSMKSFFRRFLRCLGNGNSSTSLVIQPVQTMSGIKYNYTLMDGSPPIVSPDYNSLTDLQTALINYLTTNHLVIDCSSEGMYLIEHLLLRPRDNNFSLAPICIDKDCSSCGQDDPYSFRISLVLPYWPAHFNNMYFRAYFENLARAESPAHCMMKICWINQDAMLQFELAYFIWIYALAGYYSIKTAMNGHFLQAANDNLLNILYSLHSEYPVATLHDCTESKDKNPVTLGKTVLGTINN
jgi:hypothetical protein